MNAPSRTITHKLSFLFLPFGALLTGCYGGDESLESVAELQQKLVIAKVSFQTSVGRYLGAQNNGGSVVNATATVAQGWEQFSLDDINGGELVSGDKIFIQAGNGQYFTAQDGGGSTLSAASNNRLGWETFTIQKASGSGTIVNGDLVGLRASSGAFIRAVDGGGSTVDVRGAALQGWEQLKISGLSTQSGDPTCSTGILAGTACCPAFCGACGGTGCGTRPGGTEACCQGPILESGVLCSGNEPPCIVGAAPPPPPPPSSQKKVIGYLPNWYGSYASWVSKVDFGKVTHLNLAFMTADSNGNLQLGTASDLDTLINAAHARGVKVFPSIGGGGGDASIAPWYTPGRVDALVERIITYVRARNMDGIDVDQEAPAIMGANYDTFIAKLKSRAGAYGLPVSAAVSQWMQSGMSDNTLRSFDFVNIMAYDYAGTWTGAGEHSSYSQAQTALTYYRNKGVPAEKIVLGVPFYGYCWGNCDGASSRYVLYKDIIAKFPWATNTDWVVQNGATYSFNSVATMTRKTDLGEQYGGVMIWELGGDTSTANTNSLLRTIDAALP